MAKFNKAFTTISFVITSNTNSRAIGFVLPYTSATNIIKRNVHLHGRVELQTQYSKQKTINKISPSNSSTHSFGERPINPEMLTSNDHLKESVSQLMDWFQGKKNILCITGAGISTDSGIPDYRGFKGSYHKGHKPMVHDQFMSSVSMRQRYWGRSMIGWKEFAAASPNRAHYSLAKLEEMGYIGVEFDDQPTFHSDSDDNHDAMMRWAFTNGGQKISIITQNVDGLHRKAGSKYLTELHGRNDRIKCMSCGKFHCRHEYHDSLHESNSDWVNDVQQETEFTLNSKNNGIVNEKELKSEKEEQLRPDGDAYIAKEVYDDIYVPPCIDCGEGFYKPDVVFFGDSVPRHRVERCYAAVDASDGLLCIGSSLAVHSAYRFVQHASKQGIPIAILNVGETRAEVNGLDVLKVEAPASQTLSALVERLQER